MLDYTASNKLRNMHVVIFLKIMVISTMSKNILVTLILYVIELTVIEVSSDLFVL